MTTAARDLPVGLGTRLEAPTAAARARSRRRLLGPAAA